MKHIIKAIALTAATATIAASCSRTVKTVDYPLIETANSTTLDIAKVELSDTATVLHINARYIPNYWIKISSDSYLATKGRKYTLTGSDGIEPDSLFWMPASGEASFRLMFEPLPKRTKSFDFIESDCEDCFKLYGIDLTGKTEYDRPAGIPENILNQTAYKIRRTSVENGTPDGRQHASEADNKPNGRQHASEADNKPNGRQYASEADDGRHVPGPDFTVGMTTVRMHLIHYRPELGKKVSLYVNTLLNGQQSYHADIDPETATAEFKFRQYGPANAIAVVTMGTGGSTVWLAPGDSADVYYDMRETGWLLQAYRMKPGKEADVKPFRSTYASGKYSSITNGRAAGSNVLKYRMNLYSGEFASYTMTADEYTEHVIDRYTELADSIAGCDADAMMKEFQLITLKEETVTAFAQGDFLRTHNYMNVHNDFSLWGKTCPGLDRMKPDNYAAVCTLFDINDPKLLMGEMMLDYIDAVTSEDIDWPGLAGIGSGLIPELRKVSGQGLAKKAADAAVSEEDFRMLEGMGNGFYLEAFRTMQADAEAALAAVAQKAVIRATPDVGNDRLFDAIIAPHKGKIIFVDFWNTWCEPCRYAIEKNEPLKDTALKSDDIVWIYIANETSPLVKYKTMIPEIRGLHYRLNGEQWKYLGDKFKIDGIPSYVLVDREGNYSLRNDFRDHSRLVDVLSGMI